MLSVRPRYGIRRAGASTAGSVITTTASPKPSAAERRRFSATSSANACWGCPDEHREETAMNLLPGAEQLEIVTAAGEFLTERMPVERIRANRHAEAPIPELLWRECAELGLLTLGLDEESGGSGRPLDDEGLLFIELGKRLAPGPFLACTLAARGAAGCGDVELAERIGAGRTRVALAVLRGDGGPQPLKGTFDLFEPAGA